MKYEFIGLRGYRVEISHEHFTQVKAARNHLLEALSIEDKLNLVLENYAEFERELLNIAVSNMLFSNDDWSSSIDEIHLINRRIVNLLTTCRLYIDQVSHNISSIYGVDSDQKKAVKEQTHKEYDSNLGYRVMEAMRNYIQHRELPIRNLSQPGRWLKTKKGEFMKRTIKPSIEVDSLSSDHKFKKSVLLELQNLGNSVEITPLIRQYLESIGRIHLTIRQLVKSDLIKCEAVIHSEIKKHKDYTGYSEGLRAVVIESSETICEEFDVFDSFIKRRNFLENKNRNLTNYSSYFISSEAPELDN